MKSDYAALRRVCGNITLYCDLRDPALYGAEVAFRSTTLCARPCQDSPTHGLGRRARLVPRVWPKVAQGLARRCVPRPDGYHGASSLACHRPDTVRTPYSNTWLRASFGHAGSGSRVAATAASRPTSTRASARSACTPTASSTQRPRSRSTWMCTLPPRYRPAHLQPARRTACARKA